MGVEGIDKSEVFDEYFDNDDNKNTLITIQMTTDEYEHYRDCQKEIKDIKNNQKLKEDMITSLRDQYCREFKQRQEWAKRAITAEKTLDRLLDIVHSDMPAKLRFETLTFEIEKVYKDRGYKHD